MINRGFERWGDKVWLVYEWDERDAVDRASLLTLTGARLPGLVQARTDGGNSIQYDVTARVPAREYLHGVVNRKRLLGVLRGIADALLSAEAHGLSEYMLCLDRDLIFSDVITSETGLICLPAVGAAPRRHDMVTFLKDILFGVEYDREEDFSFVAMLLDCLNKDFSANGFRQALDAVEGAVHMQSPERMTAPQVPPVREEAHRWQTGYQELPLDAADDRTDVFFQEDDEETAFLAQEAPFIPYLVRKCSNERIPIDKPLFRVGRAAGQNDYVVVGNRCVGHHHCHFLLRDGSCFVVDDHSKNHTRVNGQQITPDTETRLSEGDTVCLADEEFTFRLA